MNATELAINLIALHGSQVVGRTRLQKRTYLLHRCGGNFGLNFVYHYYGPYSFDLADGLTDARAEGLIEIEETPGRYGVPYATFRLKESSGELERLGGLAIKDALRLRGILDNEASDIVLEIAATIVFLRDEGGYKEQAIEETKVRKPLKATAQRLSRARSLIYELGLSEGSV